MNIKPKPLDWQVAPPPGNSTGDSNANVSSLEPSSYFRFKYMIERIFAFLLLIPAVPLILFFGLIVKVTSKGPAIYRQTRVGKDGKEFSMLKIRSMSADAESKSGPQWSSESDPRVTTIGRFLRFAHLDELPQLFNVVKGEMTVVGPRPERPDFVSILEHQVDHYSDRLKIKPGITGLAQIYLPPDQEIDCVKKKVCFDRAYIETANLSVDFRIWICTVVRILGVRQGRGPKWFGLDRRYWKARHHCSKIGRATKKTANVKPVGASTTKQEKRASNHQQGPAMVACTDSGIGLLNDSPRLPK